MGRDRSIRGGIILKFVCGDVKFSGLRMAVLWVVTLCGIDVSE